MGYYDESLQLLQKQVAQKKRQESKLNELYTQRQELSEKVCELNKCKLDEQDDVNRLEGHSLVAFFYSVIGKKDEKLDKERKEAYASTMKYDMATRELSAIEEDIERSEAELNQLMGCEEQYARVLQEKKDAIKSSGIQQSMEILRIEEQIAYLEGQKQEVQEAITAGTSALSSANNILDNLGSAEGWGTWDLLGGGLLTDMVKHSHLDEAQRQLETLQSQLRRFKTELTDVTIEADMQVSVDGFLCFADYFFDGLFSDWLVLDKISQSQTQVQDTKSQIERLLYRLNSIHSSTNDDLKRERAKLDDYIVRTSL